MQQQQKQRCSLIWAQIFTRVPGELGPDTNSVGVPECPAGTLCATVWIKDRQVCVHFQTKAGRRFSDQAVNVKDVLALTDPLYFISFDSELLLLLLLLFIDHLHLILFHFIFLQWMLSSSIRWGLICCLGRFCLFCFVFAAENRKNKHKD